MSTREEDFNLLQLMRVLIRRWYWALGGLVLGLAGVGVYSLQAEPGYQASATLRIAVLPREDGWPEVDPRAHLLAVYGEGDPRLVDIAKLPQQRVLKAEGSDPDEVLGFLETVVGELMAREEAQYAHMRNTARLTLRGTKALDTRLGQLAQAAGGDAGADTLARIAQAEAVLLERLPALYRLQAQLERWQQPPAVLKEPRVTGPTPGYSPRLLVTLGVLLGGLLGVVAALAAESVASYRRAVGH